MTLAIDEQLIRAERRLKIQKQKLALEQRRLAMLEKRKLRTKAGEERAEETRRKVLLGVAIRRLLAEYDSEPRARICQRLAGHLNLKDQLVVAADLGLDPAAISARIAFRAETEAKE